MLWLQPITTKLNQLRALDYDIASRGRVMTLEEQRTKLTEDINFSEDLINLLKQKIQDGADKWPAVDQYRFSRHAAAAWTEIYLGWGYF
jgi:hypothetical protein